jgi:hypothetical protein
MNKSQLIADFILKEEMQKFGSPVVEAAFKQFFPDLAPLVSIKDVHNAFQKIKRGYSPSLEPPKQRKTRRNPLVKGDYIDFAVYVATAGSRLNNEEKRKVLAMLKDKWAIN